MKAGHAGILTAEQQSMPPVDHPAAFSDNFHRFFLDISTFADILTSEQEMFFILFRIRHQK
jgi:hypothetical protein